jgi:hypothetical protein
MDNTLRCPQPHSPTVASVKDDLRSLRIRIRAESRRRSWVLAYRSLGDASAVCRRFGSSQPTLCKSLRRYGRNWPACPKSSPNRLPTGRRESGGPDSRFGSGTAARREAAAERGTAVARRPAFGDDPLTSQSRPYEHSIRITSSPRKAAVGAGLLNNSDAAVFDRIAEGRLRCWLRCTSRCPRRPEVCGMASGLGLPADPTSKRSAPTPLRTA